MRVSIRVTRDMFSHVFLKFDTNCFSYDPFLSVLHIYFSGDLMPSNNLIANEEHALIYRTNAEMMIQKKND